MRNKRLFFLLFVLFNILNASAQPDGFVFKNKIGIPIISSSASLIKIATNQNMYLATTIFIQRTDLNGNVSNEWGGAGYGGKGKFQKIIDIESDELSNIYVLDKDAKLIQKFDKDGNFILQWSVDSYAVSIYYANSSLYVLTSGSIGKYSPIGVLIKNTNISFLSSANDFCVDNSENYYVSQTYEVSKYFVTGVHSKNFGYWTFSGPGKIDIDLNYNLYVVDNFNQTINVFNQASTMVSTIGSKGTADGQFQFISSYTFDALKNIYINDGSSSNNCIQKFSPLGVYISKYNYLNFKGNGHFFKPLCMAFDSKLNVYVADFNNLIQKFDSNGNFIKQWGGTGNTNTTFSYIPSINIDGNDRIFIADVGSLSIKQFDTDGNFINKYNGFDAGKINAFNNIRDFTIDENNNHYVLSGSSVIKYTFDGKYIASWGTNGYNEGQFINPINIIFKNNSTHIFVLDANYISEFDNTGTFVSRFGINSLNTISSNGSAGLYAVDINNYIIQYDSTNLFVKSWPMKSGVVDGTFLSIKKIAKDKQGNLYLMDFIHNTIQVFTNTTIITTSILNNKNDSGTLVLYPNPSNGAFKINFQKHIQSIRVINLLGESELFYDNTISTSLKGLLIVEITAMDGTVSRSKIIVE